MVKFGPESLAYLVASQVPKKEGVNVSNPNPIQPLYLQPTPTLLVFGIPTLRGRTLCGHLCRQCSPLVLIGPPLIQARCHVTCRVSHRLLWRAAKSSRDKASESIGYQYASMTPYCPDKAHYWTKRVLWCDMQLYKCDEAFKQSTDYSADWVKNSPTKNVP